MQPKLIKHLCTKLSANMLLPSANRDNIYLKYSNIYMTT